MVTKKVALIFIDDEKVFDNLKWIFIFKTLESKELSNVKTRPAQTSHLITFGFWEEKDKKT